MTSAVLCSEREILLDFAKDRLAIFVVIYTSIINDSDIVYFTVVSPSKFNDIALHVWIHLGGQSILIASMFTSNMWHHNHNTLRQLISKKWRKIIEIIIMILVSSADECLYAETAKSIIIAHGICVMTQRWRCSWDQSCCDDESYFIRGWCLFAANLKWWNADAVLHRIIGAYALTRISY